MNIEIQTLIDNINKNAYTYLSIDSKIRWGQLSNGLRYYIIHNQQSPDFATLQFICKVGASLEDPSEWGMAHFLEHMAFRGTANFPGKSIIDFLQKNGLAIGVNFNAGTSYEYTKFELRDIPVSDSEFVDNILQIFRDWSDSLILSPEEIEAERSVILEELRSNSDPYHRMLQNVMPKIYKESNYQHPVIGTEDSVKAITPEMMKEFYNKWYRPDLQALILVGDFDTNEIEKKVVNIFSNITKPENPQKRVYQSVSKTFAPIYAACKDKETEYPIVLIQFKKDSIPFHNRNSLEYLFLEEVVDQLISSMINSRIHESLLTQDSNYYLAKVTFGNYIISTTQKAFKIIIRTKGDALAAIKEVMEILAQVKQKGFGIKELERAKERMRASCEKNYNKRDKIKNEHLVNSCSNHFLLNTPLLDFETKYNLINELIPQISLDILNDEFHNLLREENLTIVVNLPDSEDSDKVSKGEILECISCSLKKDYPEYNDLMEETKPETNLLPEGSIISKNKNDENGLITYILSNSIKIIIKPTAFKDNEILFAGVKKGGFSSFPMPEAANVKLMKIAFMSLKSGNKDMIARTRYYNGKQIKLRFLMEYYFNLLYGSSTIKDFPWLLERIYDVFTNIQPDFDAYSKILDRVRSIYNEELNTPETQAQYQEDSLIYSNNPFKIGLDIKEIESGDYNQIFQLLSKVVHNAAYYTFLFIGNIKDDLWFQSLFCRYIASIPTYKTKKPALITPCLLPGKPIDFYKQIPMVEPRIYITDFYYGYDMKPSDKNLIMLEMAEELLRQKLYDNIRGKVGGSYSPKVTSEYDMEIQCWQIYCNVETSPEKLQEVKEIETACIMNIFKNGTGKSLFEEIAEIIKKRFLKSKETNSFWMQKMINKVAFTDSLDSGETDYLNEYTHSLDSITLEDFNSFLGGLYNEKYHLRIVIEGNDDLGL